jgi:hypothetical protein
MLLTTNVFLFLLGVVLVLLVGLGSSSSLHLIEYRPFLGHGAHTYVSSTSAYLYFVAFSAFVLALHTVLSIRTYNVRRHYSILFLALGTFLLSMLIVVSYSLMIAKP